MRPLQTVHLIIAVVLLGALDIILNELRLGGHLSFDAHGMFVYPLVAINAAISIAGLWTRQRAAWLGYLVVSIAGLILIGASTPISALGILLKLV